MHHESLSATAMCRGPQTRRRTARACQLEVLSWESRGGRAESSVDSEDERSGVSVCRGRVRSEGEEAGAGEEEDRTDVEGRRRCVWRRRVDKEPSESNVRI
jgi:hypothetical protein